MNYQLMANGFPAISIAKENRLEYFNVLEAYAVQENLAQFAEMVAKLTEYQLNCYLEMAEGLIRHYSPKLAWTLHLNRAANPPAYS